jgi:ABC-type phosphate/phosphonate transport system permease subunit
MGEYLKIPPRVMFLTQCWGTIFGGFISYVVMVSIVTRNADVLTDGNGNASWSGATMQSYNTNATAWAMASYLYKAGQTYFMVPVGIAVGAALVVVQRIFAHVSLAPQPRYLRWRSYIS